MLLFNSNMRSNGGLGYLVMGILGAMAAFFLLRGLYTLLWWAAPILLIVALVIRWQVFPATFRNWWKTMRTNPLSGVIQVAFATLAFPFFALYMFLLAVGGNKIEQDCGISSSSPARHTLSGRRVCEAEEIESRPKGDCAAGNRWNHRSSSGKSRLRHGRAMTKSWTIRTISCSNKGLIRVYEG